MEQYIKKSALVAEIKKIRAKWFGINNDFAAGQKMALTEILSFIDSLEEEPVSENLLKASMKFAKHFGEWHYAMPCFQAGAEWKEKEMQSTIELAEDHAMLAGMVKGKEEAIDKAVDFISSLRKIDDNIVEDFKKYMED